MMLLKYLYCLNSDIFYFKKNILNTNFNDSSQDHKYRLFATKYGNYNRITF